MMIVVMVSFTIVYAYLIYEENQIGSML
ncbi:MAG: hypothetical protein CMA07_03905, partial [Euryarchaeota archaeon]|nr:hypothetical protein [Euryarchaeota archaeon]